MTRRSLIPSPRCSRCSSLSPSAAKSELAGAEDADQALPVLMQENHSFDNYFGTYPGADGIPEDVHARDPTSKATGSA